jgi:hypothetical protein
MTQIIRDRSFTGRLKFYAGGLRRCYRFLTYDEVRQSVAVGLLESRRRADDKRLTAKAVYKTAYALGWHRVREPQTGRMIWARETSWLERQFRMKKLPVRMSF